MSTASFGSLDGDNLLEDIDWVLTFDRAISDSACQEINDYPGVVAGCTDNDGKYIEVIFHGPPAELEAFQTVPFFGKWVKTITNLDVTDARWELSGQGCVTAGDCIQSLYYPADYDNHQDCLVTLNDEVYFSVAAFNTESGFDFLKMNGTRYSGTIARPIGTHAGTISWNADYSVSSSGWKHYTSSYNFLWRR